MPVKGRLASIWFVMSCPEGVFFSAVCGGSANMVNATTLPTTRPTMHGRWLKLVQLCLLQNQGLLERSFGHSSPDLQAIEYLWNT